jgi:hypothetical protein
MPTRRTVESQTSKLYTGRSSSGFPKAMKRMGVDEIAVAHSGQHAKLAAVTTWGASATWVSTGISSRFLRRNISAARSGLVGA